MILLGNIYSEICHTPQPSLFPTPHHEFSQYVTMVIILIILNAKYCSFIVTARTMRIPSVFARRMQFRSQSTNASSTATSQGQTAIPLTPETSKATSKPTPSTSTSPADEASSSSKPTYFKITQHRSAIGLPKRYKDTLVSLGLRRRLQTVFLPHSAPAAGKILRVKELVKVENVAKADVKTKREMRAERKAVRGYYVKQRFTNGGYGSSTSWMDGL
jgi:large subunit ribosomal protein L30